MTPADEIDTLKRRLERKNAEIAKLNRMVALAQKHLRDSFMGSVLSGLCGNQFLDHDCPHKVAEQAERIVNAVMRQRQLWADGKSVNTPMDRESRKALALDLRIKAAAMLIEADKLESTLTGEYH
jgi:hypothetical protein